MTNVPQNVVEEIYRLKPFEWEEKLEADEESYVVDVGFGSYKVNRHREDFREDRPWLTWWWGFCFDEYHDEDSFQCDSAEDGKRLAWEDWVKRVTPMLEAVDAPALAAEVKRLREERQRVLQMCDESGKHVNKEALLEIFGLQENGEPTARE